MLKLSLVVSITVEQVIAVCRIALVFLLLTV